MQMTQNTRPLRQILKSTHKQYPILFKDACSRYESIKSGAEGQRSIHNSQYLLRKRRHKTGLWLGSKLYLWFPSECVQPRIHTRPEANTTRRQQAVTSLCYALDVYKIILEMSQSFLNFSKEEWGIHRI